MELVFAFGCLLVYGYGWIVNSDSTTRLTEETIKLTKIQKDCIIQQQKTNEVIKQIPS